MKKMSLQIKTLTCTITPMGIAMDSKLLHVLDNKSDVTCSRLVPVIRPLFHGNMNSEMYFDVANDSWRIQSLRNPKRFLLIELPKLEIPFGTRMWTVGSHSALCGKDGGQTHKLTFSLCYPEMYTCNDGSCISLS